MGNEQPKKIGKASKIQVDVACLKAKIHLQLVRDRKNQQIIKGQKQLVQKIKSNSRNKTQEILIAQRIVNGLKYAQACNMLMGYAVSLKAQAQFISDNVGNQQKIQPYLMQIHSMLYAADRLGLSSLSQFKNVLKALNDPTGMLEYTNPQIIQLLTPHPTQQELNTYILEMCERNNIPLQEVNIVGHKFTKYPKGIPSIPSSQGDDLSFEEMQRKMAEELKRNFNNGGGQGYNQQGNNNGGYINPNHNPYGNNYGNNNQGFNPNNNQGLNPNNNQGFNPSNEKNLSPSQGFNGRNNDFNNNGFNPNYIPSNQPNYIPQNSQFPGSKNLNNTYNNKNQLDSILSQGQNPYGIRDSYDPKVVPIISPQNKKYQNDPYSKPYNNPYENKPGNQSRLSIDKLEDIDYYPEIENPGFNQKPAFFDPDFDKLCEQIRVGL